MNKTLVLFVFHVFNERCENFINKCIFYDPNIDFIIISNDKNATFDSPPYVKKFFRDNREDDFGAWSDAILTDNLYTNYDKFIFINSSVIGPFLRPDFKGKWTDIYLNGLKDNVKLFGSSINTMRNPLTKAHVQSYIFALNKETLEYLINEGIFSNTKYVKTFNDAINEKEILMSRKIIDKGWNIGSLFPLYNGVDFRFRTKAPEDYNIKFRDDIMYNKYFGYLWTEYELVFVQGNRDLKFAQINEPYKKYINHVSSKSYSLYYIIIFLITIMLFIRYRNLLVLLFPVIMYILIYYIRNPKYNYTLCLLVICKNESMVIDEFIQHYLWQGVEHIYLIDNGSTDNTKDLVQKYKEVSYYYLPEQHVQVDNYNKIFNKIKHSTKWLIVADADEYIYNRKKGNTIKDYVKTLDYNKIAAVHINWKMFGSSGFKKQPKHIRKSFTLSKIEFDQNVKSILNTSLTNSLNIHTHNYIDGDIIDNPKDDIALNHYAIMSEEYFTSVKMTRGDVDAVKNVRDMDYFNRYDHKQISDIELINLME